MLREIRARRRARQPLNYFAVVMAASNLFYVAYRLFGSWDRALKVAGVDPWITRKTHKWTKVRLLAELRGLAVAGVWRPSAVAITRRGSLRVASIRLFGSWPTALRAAGLRPNRVPWTRAEVIRRIRARHRAGRSLNAAAVHHDDDQALYNFARRSYSSWDRALRAAGIDVWTARKCREWTKADILREIESRRRASLPLNASAVIRGGGRQLYTFAVRRFGSWDRALSAAGVDVSTTRKKPGRRPSGGATARRPLMSARR